MDSDVLLALILGLAVLVAFVLWRTRVPPAPRADARAVLVCGPPGGGKTRLLAALAGRTPVALVPGASVFRIKLGPVTLTEVPGGARGGLLAREAALAPPGRIVLVGWDGDTLCALGAHLWAASGILVATDAGVICGLDEALRAEASKEGGGALLAAAGLRQDDDPARLPALPRVDYLPLSDVDAIRAWLGVPAVMSEKSQ